MTGAECRFLYFIPVSEKNVQRKREWQGPITILSICLGHELNEWLAERGYAGQADNRNRLAEVVTRKLRDSFYADVSWDALNVAYSEHPEWFSELASGDED